MRDMSLRLSVYVRLFTESHLFLQGDADGYDLVVVDAMHKANYASRICHSCRPNCEAK